LAVDRTAFSTQSVEYDALVVAGGSSAATLGADPYTALNLGEAYRHHKPLGAWGEGAAVLEACGCDGVGVVVAEAADADFASALIEAIGQHRHWERSMAVVR
jgi:catalase